MNVIDLKNRYFRAFTMPEVALAVGVVAFGLVAVFSVLPFGLVYGVVRLCTCTSVE